MSQNYFYVAAPQGMYSNGLARLRGGVTDDQGTLNLGGNGSAGNLTLTSNTAASFAGTLNSDNITVGKGDGNNSFISLTANTGNWTFTNVQASRNLEISDSDGTGTVMTINTDGMIGIGKVPDNQNVLDIQNDNTAGSFTTHRNNTGFALNRTYADYGNDGNTVEYQERIGTDGNNSSIGNFSNHTLGIRTNNQNRITILAGGNVGIGTTNPASKLTVGGNATGFATAMQVWQNGETAASGDIGGKAATFFGESGVSNSSIVNIYSTNGYTGQNGGEIGFGGKYASGGNVAQFAKIRSFKTNASNGGVNYGGGLEFWTRPNGSAAVPRMTISGDGNVGIGQTSPTAKLYVQGDTIVRGVLRGDNVNFGLGGAIKVSASNTASDQYVAFGTTPSGSSGTATFTEKMRIDSTGNVGIGTTSPNYKLTVSGGINAGGVVTYSKVAGGLDTTGYAVAGLGTAFNGASAGFTFTAYGGTGQYQKVVYSCFGSGTNWVVDKVIDEGTNVFDIVASAASAATIVFTFKTRSGSQGYSPRVVIEATGHSIISTYA